MVMLANIRKHSEFSRLNKNSQCHSNVNPQKRIIPETRMR